MPEKAKDYEVNPYYIKYLEARVSKEEVEAEVENVKKQLEARSI